MRTKSRAQVPAGKRPSAYAAGHRSMSDRRVQWYRTAVQSEPVAAHVKRLCAEMEAGITHNRNRNTAAVQSAPVAALVQRLCTCKARVRKNYKQPPASKF